MTQRRSSREFDAVGGVLESVLTGLEMGARTREYLALIMWPDIVGEQVARITAVQSVRNGVLHVDVETAAWAQELQFYKPDMMAKINRYIGSDAVKDVHFRVRTTLRRPLSRTGRTSTPRKAKGTPDIQLTLDECKEIEETAQKVHDPELREAITTTMASYRRLERWMILEGWKRCPECKALFKRVRGCPFCAF